MAPDRHDPNDPWRPPDPHRPLPPGRSPVSKEPMSGWAVAGIVLAVLFIGGALLVIVLAGVCVYLVPG